MAYLRVFVAVFLMIISRMQWISCSSLADKCIFNVLAYGADPNGTTDSTKAFKKAWNATCSCTSTEQQPTFYVPKGSFLVNKIQFKGPCNNYTTAGGRGPLLFQIDGIIFSPDYTSVSNEKSSVVWISFYRISGIQIRGGVLDGRGNTLWDCKRSNPIRCPFRVGSTSLEISNSDHVNVTGLTSKDSQLFHIVICNSEHVTLDTLHITAASDSPNTDGIDISRSNDVHILRSNISTGDDCISIKEGSTSIWIENVHCGPGHGISIGSLGRNAMEGGVENITVTGSTFTDTHNGLRIKTYPTKHTGFVKDVIFKHNIMNNVENPIIIDQHYCNGKAKHCSGQESGVKISNVSYIDIQGISMNQFGVYFNCSKSNPCSGLYMESIDILNGNSSCNNAFGKSSGPLTPAMLLSQLEYSVCIISNITFQEQFITFHAARYKRLNDNH